MYIETKCQCGAKLRVLAKHAGMPAQCPKCDCVYQVPHTKKQPEIFEPEIITPPRQPITESSVRFPWFLRAGDGKIFGPLDRSELEQWVIEGRVNQNCQVKQGEGDIWKPAVDVFPQVKTIPQIFTTAEHPETNPFASPKRSHGMHEFVEPHRGGLVLVFGLLSFLIPCPLFGLFAWIMGSGDLRKMRIGAMDVTGKGMTQTGHILGIISTCLAAMALTLLMLFLTMASFW